MLTATIRDEDGEPIGILVLSPKVFSSGKQGFFGQGKLVIEDKRYQCQAQCVHIEKPATPDGA